MSEEGITKDDLITAVIGLCNVIRIQDTNYRLLSARVDRLESSMEKVNDICGILLEAVKGVKGESE